MKKPGFVAKSKCWLKTLLARKTAEQQPYRELTIERLEWVAHSAGIDRQAVVGEIGMQDVVIHRILNNIHLDHEEIARREPRAYQDLLRTCLECAHSKSCSRGFERMRSVETWPSYCPNAMTLKSLLS